MAVLTNAIVKSTSPLRIVSEIDPTHQVGATSLSTYTPVVGDRVQVRLRTPRPPVIQGKL